MFYFMFSWPACCWNRFVAGAAEGKRGVPGLSASRRPRAPEAGERGCVWRDPTAPFYSSGLPTLTSPQRFVFQASLPRTALAGGWLEWIWVPGSLRPAVRCPEVWEVWCLPRAGPRSPSSALSAPARGRGLEMGPGRLQLLTRVSPVATGAEERSPGRFLSSLSSTTRTVAGLFSSLKLRCPEEATVNKPNNCICRF